MEMGPEGFHIPRRVAQTDRNRLTPSVNAGSLSICNAAKAVFHA